MKIDQPSFTALLVTILSALMSACGATPQQTSSPRPAQRVKLTSQQTTDKAQSSKAQADKAQPSKAQANKTQLRKDHPKRAKALQTQAVKAQRDKTHDTQVMGSPTPRPTPPDQPDQPRVKIERHVKYLRLKPQDKPQANTLQLEVMLDGRIVVAWRRADLRWSILSVHPDQVPQAELIETLPQLKTLKLQATRDNSLLVAAVESLKTLGLSRALLMRGATDVKRRLDSQVLAHWVLGAEQQDPLEFKAGRRNTSLHLRHASPELLTDRYMGEYPTSFESGFVLPMKISDHGERPTLTPPKGSLHGLNGRLVRCRGRVLESRGRSITSVDKASFPRHPRAPLPSHIWPYYRPKGWHLYIPEDYHLSCFHGDFVLRESPVTSTSMALINLEPLLKSAPSGSALADYGELQDLFLDLTKGEFSGAHVFESQGVLRAVTLDTQDQTHRLSLRTFEVDEQELKEQELEIDEVAIEDQYTDRALMQSAEAISLETCEVTNGRVYCVLSSSTDDQRVHLHIVSTPLSLDPVKTKDLPRARRASLVAAEVSPEQKTSLKRLFPSSVKLPAHGAWPLWSFSLRHSWYAAMSDALGRFCADPKQRELCVHLNAPPSHFKLRHPKLNPLSFTSAVPLWSTAKLSRLSRLEADVDGVRMKLVKTRRRAESRRAPNREGRSLLWRVISAQRDTMIWPDKPRPKISEDQERKQGEPYALDTLLAALKRAVTRYCGLNDSEELSKRCVLILQTLASDSDHYDVYRHSYNKTMTLRDALPLPPPITAPFKRARPNHTLRFKRPGELALTAEWSKTHGWRVRSSKSLEKRCTSSKDSLARAVQRYCKKVKIHMTKHGEDSIDEYDVVDFCHLIWRGEHFCRMRANMPKWWEKSRALSLQYNVEFCAKYELRFVRHRTRWVLKSIKQNGRCNGA